VTNARQRRVPRRVFFPLVLASSVLAGATMKNTDYGTELACLATIEKPGIDESRLRAAGEDVVA